MRNAGRAIDHLVVTVPGLDAAAAAFEALGFTLTPRAQHPWGTANRLAQLPGGNFIELLEIDRPELIAPHDAGFSFGTFSQEFLAHGPGPSMLVLATTDAEADCARFAAAGLAHFPRFDFERQGTLPDGSSATLAFSLAFTAHPAMPGAGFFTCHNRVPDAFWKPEFQRHRNGAQEIEAVLMAAEDPPAHADFLSGFADGRVGQTGDGIAISCGRHSLLVLNPAAAGRLGVTADLSRGPRFIGARIAARNRPERRTLPDPAHGLLIDWRAVD